MRALIVDEVPSEDLGEDLREDSGEGEHEVERYLGRCAAVDGMFVDVPPPPREILTLRGCAPGPVPGHLGQAWIEGCRDDGRPVRWWDLHDAEILTVAGNAAGASLVDLVVGAAVRDAPGSRTLGTGPLALFTLIWHDCAASGLALAGDRDPETGATHQDEIVDLLERHGVVVVRQ